LLLIVSCNFVARFCGLGMKSKLVCVMAQSVMMCLFEGVFHL
jgi:hypothetical protein